MVQHCDEGPSQTSAGLHPTQPGVPDLTRDDLGACTCIQTHNLIGIVVASKSADQGLQERQLPAGVQLVADKTEQNQSIPVFLLDCKCSGTGLQPSAQQFCLCIGPVSGG